MTTKRRPKTGLVKLSPQRERAMIEAARSIDATEKPQIIATAKRVLAEYDELMGILNMLKAEREKQGLTLDEMAERTGIGKSNLSKLENGRLPNPTIQTLHRIADALGRSIRVQLT